MTSLWYWKEVTASSTEAELVRKILRELSQKNGIFL
jgi:hypothetical protein